MIFGVNEYAEKVVLLCHFLLLQIDDFFYLFVILVEIFHIFFSNQYAEK